MQIKLNNPVLDAFDELGSLNEDYKSEFLIVPSEAATSAAELFLSAGKIGILDIENFHKAFDRALNNFNLLAIFDTDGKLLHKGTWGKIKEADKTATAIQALRLFWAWQFIDRLKPRVDTTAEDKEDITEDVKSNSN